ncbi:MAG: NAD(P)H-binding protein [Steroidobacteraceae bacterium]
MKRRGLVLVGLLALAGAPVLAQTVAAKPQRIVVYGGSGAIGSRIVTEALARGHEVTAVDRDPKQPAGPVNPKLKLVKGDAFDAADIGRNVAGKDVLITAVAVRPTPTRDFYVRLVKAMVEAQRSQKGKQARLFVVGGASSLETGDGKRVVDTLPASLPEGSRNEILSMVDALDYLRTVSDTSWTFFSPAAQIAPGTRTGRFRLGGDTLLKDEKGESRISMEDFAVATLDEIENPKYRNKRFTIAY